MVSLRTSLNCYSTQTFPIAHRIGLLGLRFLSTYLLAFNIRFSILAIRPLYPDLVPSERSLSSP